MRHATPAAKRTGMSDHDRPLGARGNREARLAGDFILHEQLVPEIILSSTAARASATAQAVREACAGPVEPTLLPELYLADHELCLGQLLVLPDGVGTAMLVGHNPGLEDLIEALTGERRPLSTAALAQVRLPGERWLDAGKAGRAALVRLWRP
jgi:phosphohistidine phosphatase